MGQHHHCRRGTQANMTDLKRNNPNSDRAHLPKALAIPGLSAITAIVAALVWWWWPGSAMTPEPVPAVIESPTEVSPARPQRLEPRPAADRYRVEGRIVDALGSPLDDCQITLQPCLPRPSLSPPTREDDPGVFTVRSNPDGHFCVRSSDPGPFVVCLERHGFSPWILEHSLRLRPNQKVDLGAITLESGNGLVLSVVDRHNRPIAAARVTLERALVDPVLPAHSLAIAVRKAVTDAEGQATYHSVRAGAYHLRIEAAGFETVETSHLQPPLDQQVGVSRVHRQLAPGQVLRGRVLAPDGTALAGALVHASATGRGVQLESSTDTDGEFRLTGLPTDTEPIEVEVEVYSAFGKLRGRHRLPQPDPIRFRYGGGQRQP